MDETFDNSIKLSTAAALAAQYGRGGRDLLSPLSMLFTEALGERAEVKMAGGFLSKKIISGLTLHLGEWRYTLEDAGGDPSSGSLAASRTRIVRGIALKTEEVPVPAWLEEVGLALDVEAQTSMKAQQALAKLVW